jgi:hypothetical protein
VNLDDLAQGIVGLVSGVAIRIKWFFLGLDPAYRVSLAVLLVGATAFGFAMGRRRTGRIGGRSGFRAWGFPRFQNSGEALVSRELLSRFGPPDYHLMNHVTIRMDDGTTQVDHILVSRFGVFVIESKNYNGWIFAKATDCGGLAAGRLPDRALFRRSIA